ncbi:MAG: M23 family metallopeptidase [Cryobacterium sp.]|nr:M23 family metallopeptidase [Cryobacterium sp.]
MPHEISAPARRPRTSSGRSARHRLPGLNGRAVRHLTQVRAVRSVRRLFLASLAGLGVVIAASLGVPAYAQVATAAHEPQPQILSVSHAAAAMTVQRDGYTVTAPPPLRWPLDNLKYSDGFGPRVAPCSGCSTFHDGVDFDPGYGAQVYAIAAGVVIETDNPHYVALGTYVVIRHVIDGTTIDSVYGHLQSGSMPLKVGDVVKVGQVIGLVGSTGESTGPHLHFELRINGSVINPLPWMHARLG